MNSLYFLALFSTQLDGVARPSFVSASLAGLDETTSDYAYRVQAIKETASVVYTGVYSCVFLLVEPKV